MSAAGTIGFTWAFFLRLQVLVYFFLAQTGFPCALSLWLEIEYSTTKLSLSKNSRRTRVQNTLGVSFCGSHVKYMPLCQVLVLSSDA